MLFYTHLLLLLQPLVLWLSIVTFDNDVKPPPKWILRELDVSRIRPRLRRVTPPWNMAKYDRGWEGYSVWQTGLPAFGGSPHLSCKRDQIKMRDSMDRRVTSPKRVTSPTWGPPPPCKRAFNLLLIMTSPSSFLKLPIEGRRGKVEGFNKLWPW